MPPKDPLIGAMFCLEIQGVEQGIFKEGSGFGSESEVVESREQGEKGQQIIKKIPGNLKWDDITLRRGITDSSDLWEWRQQVIDGSVDDARKDGSVVIYNQSGDEITRFNFFRGWPSKWKGPDVKADDNSVALEELTITHEGLVRAAG